jgi:hypothetical protein
MLFWSPTITCRRQDCATQIQLPYPTPPEIFESPPNWPMSDFWIVFVCPSCGRGCDYRAQDVRWRQFPTPGRSSPLSSKAAFYCEFECGHESCVIKARYYTVAENGIETGELISRCLKSKSMPLCSAGEYLRDCSEKAFTRVGQVWQIGPLNLNSDPVI